eukprot:1138351-Pelagomonas_calceolata.AAC.4
MLPSALLYTLNDVRVGPCIAGPGSQSVNIECLEHDPLQNTLVPGPWACRRHECLPYSIREEHPPSLLSCTEGKKRRGKKMEGLRSCTCLQGQLCWSKKVPVTKPFQRKLETRPFLIILPERTIDLH